MANPTSRYYIVVFILIFSAIAFPAPATALPSMPISIVEQISPVFDFPDASHGEKHVGYQYTSIRLFSVPLFIFDGQLVLYDKDTSEDLSGPELEKIEKTYGIMSRNVPLWLRYQNTFCFLSYICIFIFVLKRHFAQD